MAERRESNQKELTLAVYKCLCCNHSEHIRGKKEDYSEVKVCPKCNGAFVDTWKIAKYQQSNSKNLSSLRVKIDIDCSDALKGLKAVTRAAKKATDALKELEEQQSKLAKSQEIIVNIDGASISGSLHNPNAKEFLNVIKREISRLP
jgi:Zn-finger nucleic acid-binding protein